MEVKAEVLSIAKLSDYFFVVPDYQREYVWKEDDEVEQFLQDIDNEVESGQSYFIGSIIIVKNNNGKYDVIDGQQRLTTIVLSLCAIRDLLSQIELNESQDKILSKIKSLLYEYDLETGKDNVRLELQYPESKDFLDSLITNTNFNEETTPSIIRMQEAYKTIRTFYFRFLSIIFNQLKNKLLANYLRNGSNDLATVRISAFCVAMLSNNSFFCKENIFFESTNCR